MSLAKLLKEHNSSQSKLKEQNEQQRKKTISSVHSTTGCLMTNLNEGVGHIFENQKKLESNTQALQNQAVRFSKQTSAWLNLIDQFNKSLKELGDVENWSKVIENDMKEINASLEFITREKI